MSIRPISHLEAAGSMYPAAWKQVDMFRQSRGVDLPKWPAWCFMPMAAWYAIVSEGKQMPHHLVPDVARIAAIGTWRYSKGIYRVDPDLLSALAETTLTGPIPSEVLLRLPEWSLYVETPGMHWSGNSLHGFWVHLEWDANTERRELRMLLDTDEDLIPQILHIGAWTVTEAVDRWFSEAQRQAEMHRIALPGAAISPDAVQAMAEQVQPLLAIVMYLCADEPDIDDDKQPGAKPERPQPKRTKKHGWKLFQAEKPRYWTVGGAVGQQLRNINAEQEGERKGPKPHLRRAHWHGFWTGPREGERKFMYKWLPPTVVAGDQ